MAARKYQRKQTGPRVRRQSGAAPATEYAKAPGVGGEHAPRSSNEYRSAAPTQAYESPYAAQSGYEAAGSEYLERNMAAELVRAGEILRAAQLDQAKAQAAENARSYAASRAAAMSKAAETEMYRAQTLPNAEQAAQIRQAQGMAKAAHTEHEIAERAEIQRDRALEQEKAALALVQSSAFDSPTEGIRRRGGVLDLTGSGSLDPTKFTPNPPFGPDGGPTPSYPIMTEELGYPPSPVGSGSGTGSPFGGGCSDRAGSMGATVSKALQDVLSWKPNSKDPTGFVGALSQSFSVKTVEGVVVTSWTPRSYAVQTDLAGGVSGAQASIYTMAKTLLDQMLPLLDGLTSLDPRADEETVTALKALIKDQMQNLTIEIGNVGGPRVMRVHQYFQMLLGVQVQLRLQPPVSIAVGGLPRLPQWLQKLAPPSPQPFPYWRSPDTVLGSLGDLRDQLGLSELKGRQFVNTVADEQNVTNFRVLVDYINSLLGGWANSIEFFAGTQTPFLGTQLVIISRQLGVISETVDEVRFVLDSVFVGPAQRATLLLDYRPLALRPLIASNRASGQAAAIPAGTFDNLPPIYLEELLGWIQDFVATEAKNVIQNGGKLGIGEDFQVMIAQLYTQALGLYLLSQKLPPSGGMSTTRVQQSLYKLAHQLGDLFAAAAPVGVAHIKAGH